MHPTNLMCGQSINDGESGNPVGFRWVPGLSIIDGPHNIVIKLEVFKKCQRTSKILIQKGDDQFFNMDPKKEHPRPDAKQLPGRTSGHSSKPHVYFNGRPLYI